MAVTDPESPSPLFLALLAAGVNPDMARKAVEEVREQARRSAGEVLLVRYAPERRSLSDGVFFDRELAAKRERAAKEERRMYWNPAVLTVIFVAAMITLAHKILTR